MLAFQVRPSAPPSFHGLVAEFETIDTGIAKFDLCFDLAETVTDKNAPAGMIGAVTYPTDIFDRATVTDTVKEFELILRNATTEIEEESSAYHPGH